MSARGLFITFEGGEGCGKSTQLRLLADVLERAGLAVESLREPGGTRLGEIVRGALLDPDHIELDARAELLLYEASRAQLVSERIRPTMVTGDAVLCDRFTDSTIAYQGYGRGLPLDEIASLNDTATGGLVPDLTLLLDIEPTLGLARATGGGADRLEAEDHSFHDRVRQGFLMLAADEPQRFAVIDASRTVDEVHAAVLYAVKRVPVLAVLLREGER